MSSDPEALRELTWRVAHPCHNGNCVRVAVQGDMIIVGNTRHPAGPVLTYSRDEWDAFVDGVRRGDFDDL